MKNYQFNQSKNVLSAYRQEMNTLKDRQGIRCLTDSEKERLRDLSKWVLDNSK